MFQQKIVDIILGGVEAALARGGRVELRGFGTFSVRHRSARSGRDPKTGAHVVVNQRNLPYFKAGKEMHQRLANRLNVALASASWSNDAFL